MVDAGFADVSDSGALNHVPHCEPLDGLVLSDAARAVGAAHENDMATSLLVAAAISSLFSLRGEYMSIRSHFDLVLGLYSPREHQEWD